MKGLNKMKRLIYSLIVLILLLVTSCTNTPEKSYKPSGKVEKTSVSEIKDNSSKESTEKEINSNKVEFEPSKLISYDEFTINGKHISEEFGVPKFIESVNYDEGNNENRQGDFSQTKYYAGFTYNNSGTWGNSFSMGLV